MYIHFNILINYNELKKKTITNYSFEPQMKIFYIKKHFFDWHLRNI